MRAYQICALALVSAVLVGCGGSVKQVPNYPQQVLHDNALKALKSGRYSDALPSLNALNSRYPFGQYATQTQLDLIYAHYQNGDYSAAISQAATYLQLHPNSPDAAYALYLRGLSHWEAGRGTLESLSLTDISMRDLGDTTNAYQDFYTLVNRYPQSAYAPDARQRIIYLRNVLARHELQVADFYLRDRDYVAAVERGRWVIEHYPQAQGSYDALAYMIEGYMGLNMDDRARQTLAILVRNDPNYPRLHGTTFHPRYLHHSLSLNEQG
ncbi:Outer membrane protein assembly factor BamD [Halomonadaceae bacterium LMG 33818]|uniref:outer membrane protein assembly factor BamD n=1 Tax=Cernens ardua TaxID=3402176 RepID=UPI003EDBA9F2